MKHTALWLIRYIILNALLRAAPVAQSMTRPNGRCMSPQAAVMEADLLMNLVAAGESGDWDGELCL